MLRLGRCYPGKKTWGPAYMKWLRSQKLEHGEQRMALEELLEGVRQEGERVERLEQAIREAVPEWSLVELVTAVQAMRGFDLIAAVGVVAETGDLSRFQNPRELMGYLGLAPSESSTGDSVKRGGITKAGNGRARRILVEAAWAYRHPCTRRPGEAGKGGSRTADCSGDCVESPNATMQALPVSGAQRQAANGRRHGGRSRASGVGLGDQSRSHAKSSGITSSGAVDHWSREMRSTGPHPLRCSKHQEG